MSDGLPQPFGDFQLEIYLKGLSGVFPGIPMVFEELERRAATALAPSVWSYVAGGAGDEATQRANTAAFAGWGLIPRMLVGATERDLSVELWGRRWPAPVFLAPIGVLGLCAQRRLTRESRTPCRRCPNSLSSRETSGTGWPSRRRRNS